VSRWTCGPVGGCVAGTGTSRPGWARRALGAGIVPGSWSGTGRFGVTRFAAFGGASGFEVGDVFWRKHTPHTGAEFFDPNRADADATEVFDLVAAIIQHEADLAFDALFEDDAKFGGGKDVDFFHFGAPAFDMETAQEFVAMGGVERFIEGDFVFLFDFEPGDGSERGRDRHRL